VSVRRRTRRLIAMALAVVIVAGLVVADVVTLHQAKPSFDRETRGFQNLLKSTATTTTLPRGTTGTTTTISTSVSTAGPGTASSTNSAASTSPTSSTSP
jgi:hypothetical protein